MDSKVRITLTETDNPAEAEVTMKTMKKKKMPMHTKEMDKKMQDMGKKMQKEHDKKQKKKGH